MEYTIPVDMIKAALLSVSKEQTRYYLGGVLMQRREGVLRIVSTDGHRMFIGAINLDDGLQSDFAAILPTADVKKALTGLTRKDEFIQMSLRNDHDAYQGGCDQPKGGPLDYHAVGSKYTS